MDFFGAFLNIIQHEARHTDGKPHESCKIKDGNDKSLEYMGSYGIAVLFEHWMRHLLPEPMIAEISIWNAQSLNSHGYSKRLCTFDYDGFELNKYTDPMKFLSQGDREWLIEISGYPLD